ncbi:MAG: TRAP transporter small permease [Paracoccaceae bacterium]
MTRIAAILRHLAEGVAAILMAAIFVTFLIQIVIRYTGRLEWIATAIPALDPVHYGWTLEFCLLLWVWLIFFGAAFVVRDEDHVTFDILLTHVGPRLRAAFLAFGALCLAAALWASVGPTLDKFHILRLKRTSTLAPLLGDWVRIRDLYMVYVLFLIAAPLRVAWTAWKAIRS